MKKILLFMAALCLSSLSFAQVLVATLQHGDSIRVFYYAHAFIDAYNAATTGDVITLSAGTFPSSHISKEGLTIRGAGIDQTFISSSFTLNNNITMEGIHCSSTVTVSGNIEVHFTNMYFDNLNAYDYGRSTITGQFVNCILNDYSANTNNTPMFFNCIVYEPSNSTSNYVNCVIFDDYFSHHTHSSFINSILLSYYDYSSDGQLPATAFAKNCIGVGIQSSGSRNYNFDIFANCVSQNSTMVAPSAFSVFPNYRNMQPERFILTDSAQAVYLGYDGTQVGLYGGLAPYSPNLKYPVITRLNVAHQTTADGQLSVDIQVGYRQESEDNE